MYQAPPVRSLNEHMFAPLPLHPSPPRHCTYDGYKYCSNLIVYNTNYCSTFTVYTLTV